MKDSLRTSHLICTILLATLALGCGPKAKKEVKNTTDTPDNITTDTPDDITNQKETFNFWVTSEEEILDDLEFELAAPDKEVPAEPETNADILDRLMGVEGENDLAQIRSLILKKILPVGQDEKIPLECVEKGKNLECNVPKRVPPLKYVGPKIDHGFDFRSEIRVTRKELRKAIERLTDEELAPNLKKILVHGVKKVDEKREDEVTILVRSVAASAGSLPKAPGHVVDFVLQLEVTFFPNSEVYVRSYRTDPKKRIVLQIERQP